jgi:hypothetical protein
METAFHHVADLPHAQRQALEHLLGRSLQEGESVLIRVVVPPECEGAQSPESKAGASELPEWCNVYAGLTDETVAQLDAAIARRLNLSRTP